METGEIKRILSDFVRASLQSSKTYGFTDGTRVNLDRSIYEIQSHLRSELESYDVNTQLDSKIISNSILASFTKNDLISHRPHHYAFPFLKFVYHHFRVDRDVLEYVDEFIDVNREQLSWQDIVITKTGATRCKTNTRFSLNLLRDLNLVGSRSENNKRTVMPTVIGQLVVHYFDWMNSEKMPLVRPEACISIDGYRHFTGHLMHLKDPVVLTEFLDFIKRTSKLPESDSAKLDSYLNLFLEVILSALSVSKKGISYSPELKNTAAFKILLSRLNEESLFLPADLR